MFNGTGCRHPAGNSIPEYTPAFIAARSEGSGKRSCLGYRRDVGPSSHTFREPGGCYQTLEVPKPTGILIYYKLISHLIVSRFDEHIIEDSI